MLVETYATFVCFWSVEKALMRRRPPRISVICFVDGSSLKRPVRPPTDAATINWPAGVHQYCCGSYCHEPTRFTGVPPETGTMYRRLDATRDAADVNVTDLPSGDQAMSPSSPT